MSALFYKELRLLRSVWITAMLLILAPIALGKLFHYNEQTAFQLTVCAGILGCAILGVAGFGWEFESRTFSLLLVQPRERRQFWRAKIGALVVSLLPLGLAVLALGFVNSQEAKLGKEAFSVALVALAAVSAVVTSGLWTTLLLRQIFGSIVFSIIAPMALTASVTALFDERVSDDLRYEIIFATLIAYSIAGYFLARWLFRTAQDTQWTGGNLSLSSVGRWLRRTPATTAPKQVHPLRALFGKEMHLHESSLIAAGILLLLQLITLVLSWFVKKPEESVLGMLPQMLWMLWLLMPALIGCSTVAEERKLGTIEPQLCLPVSRVRQFMVKGVVTLLYGLALGAIVPILTSPLVRIREPQISEFFYGWVFACLGITIVGFYASSLARQMLQALGVGIAFVALWAFLLNWLNGEYSQQGGYFTLFGHYLWRGLSVFIVGALVMLLFAVGHTVRRWRGIWVGILALILLALYLGPIRSFFASDFTDTARILGIEPSVIVIMAFLLCPAALLLALTYRNFKHPQVSAFLWRSNIATWAGCLLITLVVTALVYNRVWEFRTQVEPPAGPLRFSGTVRPAISGTFDDSPTFVLLPDGRLCWYKGFERAAPTGPQTASTPPTWSESLWRAIKHPQVEFIAGSNWVAIAKAQSELVGMQSDGSLWRAYWFELVGTEGTVIPFHTFASRPKGVTLRQTSTKLERIGNESDWKAVAAGRAHAVALKRDGTIWGWGINISKQLGEGPMAFTNGPVRISNESDWTNVFAGQDCSFGIKRDGSIWKWGARTQNSGRGTIASIPVKLGLDVKGVRAIMTSDDGYQNYDLILDETGKLWGLEKVPWYLFGTRAWSAVRTVPQRLYGQDWSAISFVHQRGLAGLKDDGTLWDQDADDFGNEAGLPQKQIGHRTDWIAVTIERDSILALAKDGTLCRFGESFRPHPGLELLAPLRHVTWSVNVLDAAP